MPDDSKFEGFSQQIAGEEKVLQEATKSANQYTAAVQRQTKAMQSNQQAWGRLRDEQTTFLAKFKETFNAIRTSTNDFAGAGRAIGGFTDKLKQGSTVTAVYQRKLDAMRKGQAAFASTMVATTNNISSAMDKSQQYVDAVHDSYRNAHKMAAEFRVETKAMQQAVDDLNSRFATQIAVSGDMTGALKSMQREAFIMSKYLGTSMTDVMDSWQERLQQSTGSMDDARKEMVRVTYQADRYAQEVQKLGDAYLKTGNIGKEEFVRMVRDVGKQFRTGTVQLDGYANALTGLLAKTKQMGLSTNEQRVAAEGFQKTVKSMFTMDSDLAFFGMKAAEQVRKMWDDPQWMAQQDEQVKKRLEMVKKRFAGEPEIVQTRAIMDVLRGSSAGSAMGMRLMSQMGNLTLNRELIAKQTEGNLVAADEIARQIQSGEAANKLEQKSSKEAKKQRDDQTEIWKQSIEKITKASLTPKSVEYKMYAKIHEIHKLLEYWSKQSLATAAITQGLSIGGNLLMNKLATGSFLGMARGGGGLLAGGAGTAASGGGGAATAVTGAGGMGAAGAAGLGAAAALGGVAIGTLADWGFGKAVSGGMLGERQAKLLEKSGDKSFTNWISMSDKFGYFAAALGPAGLAMKGIADLWAPRDAKGWEMIKNERTLLEGQEFEKRKKMIDQLSDQIKMMEKREKDLTDADRKRLALLKKQRDQIKKTIQKRLSKEEEESREATKRVSKAERVRMLSALSQAQGGSPEEVAKSLLEAKYQDPTLGPNAFFRNITEESRYDPDALRMNFMTQYKQLSAEQQKRIGDPAKVVEALVTQAGRERLMSESPTAKGAERIKEMSLEELRKTYKTKYGEQLMGAKITESDLLRQSIMNRANDVALHFSMASDGSGDASEVTTNAKGETIFRLPGQTVKLKQLSNVVGTQTQKQASKG